ncbi:MAG: DUF3276 family protein [Tepidisphaeraceae bacterium]
MATPTRTIGSTRDKRPARPSSAVSRRIEAKPSAQTSANTSANGKPEPKILFQKFFHSVGPRTYASQVKELPNRNHLLVLTEGKRDRETGEVRKTRLFIYGEDFSAFFRLLHETATFIRANPLSEEIRRKRGKFWAKKNRENSGKISERA